MEVFVGKNSQINSKNLQEFESRLAKEVNLTRRNDLQSTPSMMQQHQTNSAGVNGRRNISSP